MQLVQRARGRHIPHFSQIRHILKVLSPVEQKIMRISFAAFLMGLLWLIVQIGLQHRVLVPAVGGKYIEGVLGAPEFVNPIFAQLNDVDMDISRLIYTGLMRYDDKQRLVPDLASSYKISDDKKTYTFDLRRDVLWHDGEHFTANDVAFTIETAQNPVVASPLIVAFQGIETKVIDDYTIQFTLKEPFSPFLSSLTVGIIPEHIWSNVPPERMRLHKNNLQAIGTGPFKFKRFLKDDTGYIYRYELVRNDRYYKQSPYIEEFTFQFFGEFDGESGAIQAIREQKVDGLSFVPHDLRDKVERKRVALHTFMLPQYTAFFFNQDHNSALKLKEVRSALEIAIDKDRILRDAIGGEGEVISSPILPGYPGYASDIPKTSYSPEEANKLLDSVSTRITAETYRASRRDELMKEIVSATSTASASTSVSATTANSSEEIEKMLDEELNEAQVFYRKDKNGKIFELTIVTADTAEYKQAAELVAGFWQDVGVKTVIQRVPSKEIGKTALKNRDYDILLYGLIIGGDPDQYPFWHSSQIDFPGLNLSRYINRNVDTILVKARENANADESAELYKKFQDAILLDRPAIFLYTPTYTYATNDRVLGISGTRIFHPSDRLNSIAGWYIKTKWQWK